MKILFSNSQPKKKKQLHLHNRFYAIKDGQIRQNTYSHVLDLAKICV